MDLHLQSESDGLKVIRHARQNCPAAIIAVLTGISDAFLLDRLQQENVDAILDKNLIGEKLVTNLTRLLNGKRGIVSDKVRQCLRQSETESENSGNDLLSKNERLKQKVIREYGIDPDRENLPHDVMRWVRLIHEHLTEEELTVEWLKQQTRSYKRITERLHHYISLPPKAYILMLRLQLSKKLLAQCQHSPTKTALDVGFSDSSSFSKAYSTYFGYPPSTERK